MKRLLYLIAIYFLFVVVFILQRPLFMIWQAIFTPGLRL